MTELKILKASAKLRCSTAYGNNESAAKFEAILDQIAALVSVEEFEGFVSALTVGA